MEHHFFRGVKILFPIVSLFFGIMFSEGIKAQNLIPFDSLHWDLKQARVVDYLGRQSMTGSASLTDQVYSNGILEVDIATEANVRAYPAIFFRKKDGSFYERIYLRPHRSNFYDDALQYAPVFNGADSWQLYNGPGKTASLEIPPGQWNHLKIIVSGERADVYWNNDPKPAMIIEKLEHGISAGSVELVSSAPGKIYFSNFSMISSDTIRFQPTALQEPVCGIISLWEISSPYNLAKVDLNNYPSSELLNELSWQKVLADNQGLVDISRYYARKSAAGDCIMAKTIIKMEKDSLMRLAFGYSDLIIIYLNKIPVYAGNSFYQSRDRSFLGIVGYNDFLFLPMKKGENELAIQLYESLGGWGFCFRNENEVCLHPSVKKAFTLKDGISFPEAVLYDEEENVCYVSNYFNEGDESLSRITLDGKIRDAWWIRGLQMPTGMCVKDHRLYSVDRKSLTVIDTRDGAIIEKIPLTEMQMPNDAAINKSGDVFISDTPGNAIYRYSGGKLETWIGPGGLLESPNALFAEKGRLLVGQNEKLLSISFDDKKITTIVQLEKGSNVDGIQPDGKGNYLISDYRGKLYRVSPAGEKEVLINTSTIGDNIADFAYIPYKKLILIPTLTSNTVTGYFLKD